MRASESADATVRGEGEPSAGGGVKRLVGWILAGALASAAVAWLALEVGGVSVPTEVGVGLGGALGGGFGAVAHVLTTADASVEETDETVAVSMDDGDGTTPRADDFFDAHPDPTVYYASDDGSLVVRAANPAFEQAFGPSTGTLSGTPLGEALMTADDEMGVVDRLQAGETVDSRVACETTDGEAEFRLRGVSLGPDGRQGYLTYTDTAIQQSRERDLERQNERLEEFASVVSHELRNPIDSARTRVQVAQETGEDVHFEKAIGSLDKMLRIIEDLLTLASEGNTVEEPRPVELSTVVDVAWGNVDAADATLSVENDLGTIRAADGTLQHLFENLFRNAVDHGGSSATVTVGRFSGGFYVADDGAGVPPRDRERVFEPGFSTSSDGTGLGLKIVHRIADAHDWSVEVTDSESGGARFEVSGVVDAE